MIFGDDMDFFIQSDVLIGLDQTNGFLYGPLNIWIDGKAYPGKGTIMTLNCEAYNLVQLFFDVTLNWPFKGSNLPIEQIDFDSEEINKENILFWNLGDLWDNGLSLMCEIVGENLRIFYKQDNMPYQEKVIPLEYYKKIMVQLDEWIKSYYVE